MLTLVVFDLDGTLLNGQSTITPYTTETLVLLEQAGIAYTVATGRTLQAATGVLEQHRFTLPHILKNGAVIWCPDQNDYSHRQSTDARRGRTGIDCIHPSRRHTVCFYLGR